MSLLEPRHIQEVDSNSTLVHHWGYADRVLPCTSDAGSCEYLDAVYWMHDTSMLYTFVLWAVIAFVFVIAVTLRLLKPVSKVSPNAGSSAQKSTSSSRYYRAWRGVQSSMRKWLLPESFVGFFGHVTRLKLLVLAILLVYLLIFSLIGIVYKTWITPIKNSSLHNTRTGLGGFSDRVGALAYALTPLTVAFSTRESILTLATGIPYQSFNFLHRWLGRVIFIQAFLHTLGWTLIEGRFYQPQPSTYKNFIKQTYIIWGCIAMLLITFLYIFSLRRVIRRTGHEFSRKTHYIVAMLYLGACWGHWNQLACWMIASLGIWGIDRGIRILRTLLVHTGCLDGSKALGFLSAQSSVRYFDDEDGGVIRLEFDHNHDSWEIGQHFFLCFPALTVWQSHPLTVASVSERHPSLPHHTYIIRCRNGETGRLKALACTQEPEAISKEIKSVTTPVILCGPYGKGLLPTTYTSSGPNITNILAIAGGTGVSLTLPLVLAATAHTAFEGVAIEFIWIIRRSSNIQWISAELEELKRRASSVPINFNIQIYVTQEHNTITTTPVQRQSEEKSMDIGVEPVADAEDLTCSSESELGSSNFKVTYLNSQRPVLQNIASGFMETRASFDYRTRIIASGPAEMGYDLRAVVAGLNNGGRVWRGEKRWDVDLHWDDRMG